MTRYRVRFWYYTDLRCEKVVLAASEIQALAVALYQIQETLNDQTSWVESRGFRVEVDLGD